METILPTTASPERAGPIAAALATAALLAGCAGSTPPPGGPLAGEPGPAAPNGGAAITYKLSKEELAFDCQKLTGRMRLRILQVRGAAGAGKTSDIGRTMQSAAKPIFGGTTRGMDPAAELSRDRAMLHAYNRRLAEKKCKTIDLEKELAARAG
jgi:hypothetical protein